MKKILMICHFTQAPGENGNNRFKYLAELFAENGYSVEVVSTDFVHEKKTSRVLDREALSGSGYKFTAIREPGYTKNVSLKRFYSHYIFGRNLKKYLDSIEKPDLVYAAIPSNDVGSVAAKYCKKNNIPLVFDIQDLWPEAFKLVLNIPVVSDIIFAPMKLQADRFYAQADRIVAVSDTYVKRGLEACKKDKNGLCVFLGTDMQTFDSYAAASNVEKPENEIWITYVGTLGHSYNIEIVIDAIKLLPNELKKNLVFKVLGDGPLTERFKAYAAKSGERVDFLGRQPYDKMVGILSASDIAVNPISKGAAQSIINKHADYAMSGLPVVSTQESPEYRALLDNYSCGINCRPDSQHEVADAIELLIENEDKRLQMGKNSRLLAEEKFDRRKTYSLVVEIVDRIIKTNTCDVAKHQN